MAKVPLSTQIIELQDENSALREEITELRELEKRCVDREELAEAVTSLKTCADLVVALFVLLHDVESGAIDEHVYRKEKLALWRLADSLDFEVPK